jgi:hypothetical protein
MVVKQQIRRFVASLHLLVCLNHGRTLVSAVLVIARGMLLLSLEAFLTA